MPNNEPPVPKREPAVFGVANDGLLKALLLPNRPPDANADELPYAAEPFQNSFSLQILAVGKA